MYSGFFSFWRLATLKPSSRAFILEQWWVPTFPGLAILIASLAFNLLGDGLQKALDPKRLSG